MKRPSLATAPNLRVWLAWVCEGRTETIRSAQQLYGIAMSAALAEHGNPERVIPLQGPLRDVAIHVFDAMQQARTTDRRAA